jgi:uncharacterized protein YqgV (UPF0045/DUF77 family)
MIKVEFTVEPFNEGSPGAHVTETIAAVQSLGYTVEVGPFGSVFEVPVDRLGDALETLSATAYSHGATHVIIETSRDSGGGA